MKKLILMLMLGAGLAAAPAKAHDYDNDYDQRPTYNRVRHDGRVAREINHVNRMLNHVRWEFRRYGGGWHVRRELGHVSGEVDRLNWQYQNGRQDSYWLRRQVAHIHDELHHLEQELHVRAGDYYRWD